MKIACIDKEVRAILESGYYKIPRFQRPYSWDRENIEEFWNDAIRNSESDYFIGSIVVFKLKDGTYGVVDGQQRLTTITMILCALRNIFRLEGFSNHAQGINNLIERPDIDYKLQYVLQTETSYPYLQEYIQKFDKPEITPKVGIEEYNLKTAFDNLTDNIQKLYLQLRMIHLQKTTQKNYRYKTS